MKSAALKKSGYPQVPGSIPAENTSTQIHMDLKQAEEMRQRQRQEEAGVEHARVATKQVGEEDVVCVVVEFLPSTLITHTPSLLLR